MYVPAAMMSYASGIIGLPPPRLPRTAEKTPTIRREVQFLFDLVEALDVDLIYTELPPDRDGEYDDSTRTIYIQDGLRYRLHRHTLAHELGHAYYRDVRTLFGPVNAKQERRANEFAALTLINRDDYKRAELIHDGHVPSIAHELGVVTRTVRAYQRTLCRIGDTVYQKPRMGVGNWDYRELAA